MSHRLIRAEVRITTSAKSSKVSANHDDSKESSKVHPLTFHKGSSFSYLRRKTRKRDHSLRILHKGSFLSKSSAQKARRNQDRFERDHFFFHSREGIAKCAGETVCYALNISSGFHPLTFHHFPSSFDSTQNTWGKPCVML